LGPVLKEYLSCVRQIQQLQNRQPGVPAPVRYTDFLDLVEKGQIEKVTFSADGQKLVATDTDGARYVIVAFAFIAFMRLVDTIPLTSRRNVRLLVLCLRYRLDALPNDPDLLATLTQKMVDVTVLPEQPKSEGFNFFQSILFPGLLFLGLFFLARRGGCERLML
jgi:cell division protease FtsH